MYYKLKNELLRKVGLLGVGDVKKLAPIGDLGYRNGWYPCGIFPTHGTFMDGGLERLVYEAACDQGYRFKCISHNERGTDTVYFCEELGMTFHEDSSD
jgi:hypothetical protein